MDNSREALRKNWKDKKTSIFSVDTIGEAENTIGNSREPFI